MSTSQIIFCWIIPLVAVTLFSRIETLRHWESGFICKKTTAIVYLSGALALLHAGDEVTEIRMEWLIVLGIFLLYFTYWLGKYIGENILKYFVINASATFYALGIVFYIGT